MKKRNALLINAQEPPKKHRQRGNLEEREREKKEVTSQETTKQHMNFIGKKRKREREREILNQLPGVRNGRKKPRSVEMEGRRNNVHGVCSVVVHAQ